MNTETEANPAAEETVTPEVQETEAPVTEANDEAEDDELAKLIGDGPEEGEPELVEIEIDGKKIKVSQEGKDYLLRQQDYTKKTMDLAEQRKAAEALQTQLTTLAEISAERLDTVFRVQQAKAQIAEIEAIPIDGLTQEQINAFRLDLQDLHGQVAQLENHGRQLSAREEQERSQQFAKARDYGIAEAAKIIPNFEARRPALEAFAISRGASQQEVNAISDPAVWSILDDADIGARFKERQRKATAIKTAQAAQPAPEVGGKSSASSKDPNKMSPEEYHAMRLKQRAGT